MSANFCPSSTRPQGEKAGGGGKRIETRQETRWSEEKLQKVGSILEGHCSADMTRDEIKDICADEETQAKNKESRKGSLTSEILEDVANKESTPPPEVCFSIASRLGYWFEF